MHDSAYVYEGRVLDAPAAAVAGRLLRNGCQRGMPHPLSNTHGAVSDEWWSVDRLDLVLVSATPYPNKPTLCEASVWYAADFVHPSKPTR